MATTHDTDSLASLVRALRERVPLTQEELAERSGLSVGTVRGLEAGRIRRPRSGSVRGLIEALGLEDAERAALVAAAKTTTVREQGGLEGFRSVGRDLELAELGRALTDAVAGRGRTVLVVGEPGIGKTLLIEDAARSAAGQGAHVIVVRCPGNEGTPPYWPWSEALRACAAAVDAGARRQADPAAGELHRLLPHIAIPASTPAPADNDASRIDLFHRVVTVFHAAARRSPVVIVLDDLHRADTPSLKLFELLASTVPTVPLLLVGTYRDTDGVDDPPAVSLAAGLSGDARCIELRPLAVDALGRLIAATSGAEPAPALVAWVHRHTGGNPLFAQEVVRLLVAEDRLDRPPRELLLPSGVRGVIERRLHGFDPTTTDALRWAAICGDDFPRGLLERASGLAEDEISTALAVARRSRLVRPLPGRPGWHTFTHGLVAEALRDTTPPADLARRHHRIGEILIHADDQPSRLAEISYHLFAALPGGDIDLASDYAVRAARQATEALAWEEATRHYSYAIQALRLAVGTEPRVAELLVERADVAGRTDYGPEARQAALEAVEAARRHGSPLLLGQAALVFSARTFADGGDAKTTAVVEAALSHLNPDDSPIRAVLMARLAEELHNRDRRRSRQLTDQALAMADRMGDPVARWEALMQKHRAVRGGTDLDERTSTSRELVDLAVLIGEDQRTLLSRNARVVDLMKAGLPHELDEEINSFARTVDQARLHSFRWYLPLWRSSRATAEGQLAEAEALVGEVHQLATVRGDYAMRQFATLLAGIRWQQCRIAEVEPAIAAAAERHPTMPVYRCALAAIHGELGHPASAQALLEPLAVNDFADVPRLDNDWVLAGWCIAEACVAVQRRDWGQAIYRRLLPYAHHHVASGSGALYLGPVARTLGMLAALAGEVDAADTHYGDALVAAQRFGTALWAAQTKLDWAALLLTRERPGDRESARRLVEDARAFAVERDIARLHKRVAELQQPAN